MRRVRWCAVGAMGIVAALGCGGPRNDGEPQGGSAEGGGSASSASTTTAGGDGSPTGVASSQASGGRGSSGSPIFDVGTHSDAGTTVTPGCDKVDFLFVIDDSDSMADEQGNLAASLPGFISGIESTLSEVEGFHVGVVATDEYARNPDACRVMGAMITQTSGPDSSGAQCGPFAEGHTYLTEADAPNFAHLFDCVARIGTGGSGNERPMDALRAAISPDLVGPGGCNEGFLRPDALLVVVLITDEEDDHEMLGPLTIAGSADDPPKWFSDVVAIKGVQQNVAVLSLIGHDKPNACPDFQWDGFNGAEISPRLIAFTEMFDNGFVGDVCAPSYDDFFMQAVSVVGTACNGFIPPG